MSREAALKNAQAIDAQMKQLEARVAVSSGAAQRQLVKRLARLRAARNSALNA